MTRSNPMINQARVGRMNAQLDNGPRADRDPLDWYVEPRWAVDALLDQPDVIHFANDVIWDPSCGRGGIPHACAARGLRAMGTDIVHRPQLPGAQGLFAGPHDFIGGQRHLLERQRTLSIVMNPPYSYKRGIAEAFVRQALAVATHQVAALLPIKSLCGQRRHRLFAEHRPSALLIFSERPSMPPGAMIEALGDDAFENGKVDYSWIVWTKNSASSICPTIWLPPRPPEARARRRPISAEAA